MKLTLFQFAILLHQPKSNSILLVPPTALLASKESTVRLYAARQISDEYLDRLDQIEILIRQYNFSLLANSSTTTIVSNGTGWVDYSGVSSRGNSITGTSIQPSAFTLTSGTQVVTLANAADTQYYCAKNLNTK